MRKLAATLSLSVGLTATVPAIAQDPFAAAADPFAAAAPVNGIDAAPATAEEPTSEPTAEPAFTPPVFTSAAPQTAAESVAAPSVEPAPQVEPAASSRPAVPTEWTAVPQEAPMPPAQTEPPVPFGQFVPVYEPNPPQTAAAVSTVVEPYRREHRSEQKRPPADIVLPPRTTRREPHPADQIDPLARQLIRQRELTVARQRTARIQYRKWLGISLLRPNVGDLKQYNRAAAQRAQTIHFRSR